MPCRKTLAGTLILYSEGAGQVHAAPRHQNRSVGAVMTSQRRCKQFWRPERVADELRALASTTVSTFRLVTAMLATSMERLDQLIR